MVLLSRPRKVKPYLQVHTNPQGKRFGSSKTSHCFTCVLQVHDQSLKVSPTPTLRGRVLLTSWPLSPEQPHQVRRL